MEQKTRISYADLLKRLEIPEDAPETKRCTNCGQNMHLVKVNKWFAFMIHRPEEQARCAEANPANPGTPLIWSNKDYLLGILDRYYEEVTGMKPKK